MRRFFLSAVAVILVGLQASSALAQTTEPDQADEAAARRAEQNRQRQLDRQFQNNQLPIPDLNNTNPCPFVKVLYDASRYVEFAGAQRSASNVAWSGEIQGVTSSCTYNTNNTISVKLVTTFAMGRGPQAQGTDKDISYFVAVTHRNAAVLAKERFGFAARMDPGVDRTLIFENVDQITIPLANKDVSGENFEVLVGFEVTPEMAEFNRSGNRFLVNADGRTAATVATQ